MQQQRIQSGKANVDRQNRKLKVRGATPMIMGVTVWYRSEVGGSGGLSFHLHNGRTTNAFCINSVDLMAVSGEAAQPGGRPHASLGNRKRGYCNVSAHLPLQRNWCKGSHYTVMTSEPIYLKWFLRSPFRSQVDRAPPEFALEHEQKSEVENGGDMVIVIRYRRMQLIVMGQSLKC